MRNTGQHAARSRAYNTGVQHPSRAVRLAGMGLMYLACVCRAAPLLWREGLLAWLGVLVAAHAGVCSAWLLAGAALGALWLWCTVEASRRVEFIRGHRAGAKGFAGEHCENTIEAMQALLAADNGPEGPLPDLVYVEIDVQETADGELIVLHDRCLSLAAFPNTGPNVAAYAALLAQAHLAHRQLSSLTVGDVTAAQLRSLHLGGRPGLHAPRLADFLAAFRAAGSRRPLVVEVKRLRTDAGRELLLRLLSEHRVYAEQQEKLHAQFRDARLGFLGVIAFPHHFAASFGEFGSRSWARWAGALAALGLPVRCCFLERLSYCHGLPAPAA